MFDNKSILIMGETGFFGKYCTKTILESHKNKKLIIYSRDELKQFEMQQDFNAVCTHYFIGDSRDQACLSRVFEGVDMVLKTQLSQADSL